jgi:type II secretory pathway component PulC
MGQQPPAGQAPVAPATTQQKTPPAVSQPSNITNMKIKQQLAKSQAGGTK